MLPWESRRRVLCSFFGIFSMHYYFFFVYFFSISFSAVRSCWIQYLNRGEAVAAVWKIPKHIPLWYTFKCVFQKKFQLQCYIVPESLMLMFESCLQTLQNLANWRCSTASTFCPSKLFFKGYLKNYSVK